MGVWQELSDEEYEDENEDHDLSQFATGKA